MRDKLLNIRHIGPLVKSGDMVAVCEGRMTGAPMAMIREILRGGIRDLKLLAPSPGGMGIDVMIGAGAARSVEFPQMALWDKGTTPAFRRMAQEGRISCLDHACHAILAALQAGAMGIPFIPVRGLLGSDYLKIREEFKIVKDPYSGEELVVVPAIVPDVALMHGTKGDRFGNVLVDGREDEMLVARAARRVIVSVEEVVESGEIERGDEGIVIPHAHVDAVVHAPFGAHPLPCAGYYQGDEEGINLYFRMARTGEGMQEYLDRHVFGLKGHRDYLKAVGLLAATK